MFEHGYIRLGRLAGVDLLVHWSVPAAAALFGGLSVQPLVWLACAVVIVIHALGHVALVKLLGFPVLAIELTGLGGHCRFKGSGSPLERSWIAWGGILAQLVLLALVLLGVLIAGAPRAGWVLSFGTAFIEINLWVIVLNLLPFAPLDGAHAWRLFNELKAARLTPAQALLRPLGHWARQRRQIRHGAPELRRPAAANGEGEAFENEEATADLEPGEDADAPQPSPAAQRELAALFERVAEEAARAKRRR